MNPIPKQILPIIVISQFCCTSLWFAGNGVMGDIVREFGLVETALAHLTSSVQFGFISGTLVFAFLSIADRFSPSKVFFTCALLGAIFNTAFVWKGNTFTTLLLLRFFTGFFLAGIYPVGMKIAADYYEKGLGKSLGFLVGALVIGTGFPHLLTSAGSSFSWTATLLTTSALATLGGLLMVSFVPDGPHRKPAQSLDFSAMFNIFGNKEFRSAAFGYFGHMWELYAFWAFVPIILQTYANLHPQATLNIPLWSFAIIGIGSLACVLGGYLSEAFGTKRIAFISLLLSGILCLASPFLFSITSPFIFLALLLLWGMAIIADSPLFSTLVAQNASPQIKGTALTIVNCIGFSITIFSIQLLSYLLQSFNPALIYLSLAVGPALGLAALLKGKGLKTTISTFKNNDES